MKYPHTNKKYNRRNVPLWRRRFLVVVILLLVAGLGVSALAATGHLPFVKDGVDTPTPPSHSANSETKGEGSNDAANSSDIRTGDNSAPSDNKAETDNTAPTTPGEKPMEPDGTFVSTHQLSLSSRNQVVSSCSTTPGASCKIIFTKNGVTRELPVQKTDAGGGAYWSTTLQKVGLTVGDWHIQAQAILASQVTTKDDGQDLVVSQ